MIVSRQFIRFCLVGLINTSVDATIFVLLRQAHVPLVIANIISTTVGLITSLLLNYRFTFATTQLGAQKIALYIGITLCGLWALQPAVIAGLQAMNTAVPYVHLVALVIGHEDVLHDLLPKLGSVAATLTWNYLWYSKLIFKSKTVAVETAIAQE